MTKRLNESFTVYIYYKEHYYHIYCILYFSSHLGLPCDIPIDGFRFTFQRVTSSDEPKVGQELDSFPEHLLLPTSQHSYLTVLLHLNLIFTQPLSP